MMRLGGYLFFLLCAAHSFAQQFPQYTQFLFNKIGYNPAASGTSLGANYEIIFGARTQWIGVPNNPKSAFVSFNYNFVPQHAYHNWHNVGMYIAQDQNGAFVHQDIWLSYAYHLLVMKKIVVSTGVFVGFKQFKLETSYLDKNDPAVNASANSVLAIPDIVPGIRLSNKKFFTDFSLQNVSMYSQRGIGGTIGTPSRLLPHYNLSAGKKGSLNDYNVMVLAMNLRGPLIGKPSIELNLMNYYDKRFGFGFSVRPRNFVCGIIQFRLFQNMVVGLAYDLSTNRMLRASPNTVEVMIGITPVFNGERIEKTMHHPVDQCTF